MFPPPAAAGCPHGCRDAQACRLLEGADRARAAGAGARDAARVPAAADGLFLLRGVGSDGNCRNLLGQARPELDTHRARLAHGLVHPALDHQDGVRRVGRHRAGARLAAPCLCVHGRRSDRAELRSAVGSLGPLDHDHAARYALCRRRHSDGHRCRAAGRRRRCHEHGGGAQNQPRWQPSPESRYRSRPRHGSGAGPPRAVASASSPSPGSPGGWRKCCLTTSSFCAV